MNLFLKPNSENVYLKNVNLIDKIQWTRITLSKTLSLSYIEDFIVIQIFSQTWCAPSFTTIWVWSWCFLLINKVKCSDLCGFKCFCCWTEILPCVYDFAICTECANITQVAHGIWYGMVWYGGGGYTAAKYMLPKEYCGHRILCTMYAVYPSYTCCAADQLS